MCDTASSPPLVDGISLTAVIPPAGKPVELTEEDSPGGNVGLCAGWSPGGEKGCVDELRREPLTDR